jgi:hypothetical protein
MAGGPTRQDTFLVSVRVEDMANPGKMIDLGTFDKMTGGDLDSNDVQYRPGGMGPPISLGGPKTANNVTVTRLYRLERDHNKLPKLLAAVGGGHMHVSKQPLDLQGNVFGSPIVLNGRLKMVKHPDVDSEANAAALLELEMTVEGYPTA